MRLNLSSNDTGFIILKFNRITLWVLSFLPKLYFPLSPVIFRQELPLQWRSGARRHASRTRAGGGRVPDLRHQRRQAALEKRLREDQVFKEVLVVQLPRNLELFQVFVFLVR